VKKLTKKHQPTEKKNSNHQGNYDKNKIAEPSTNKKNRPLQAYRQMK